MWLAMCIYKSQILSGCQYKELPENKHSVNFIQLDFPVHTFCYNRHSLSEDSSVNQKIDFSSFHPVTQRATGFALTLFPCETQVSAVILKIIICKIKPEDHAVYWLLCMDPVLHSNSLFPSQLSCPLMTISKLPFLELADCD